MGIVGREYVDADILYLGAVSQLKLGATAAGIGWLNEAMTRSPSPLLAFQIRLQLSALGVEPPTPPSP